MRRGETAEKKHRASLPARQRLEQSGDLLPFAAQALKALACIG
jgi:hypothetical protein